MSVKKSVVNMQAPSFIKDGGASTEVLMANGTVSKTGEVALGAGTAIDWSLGITFTKTLSATWTMTFTNPVVGKTIMIVPTGNFTINLPTGVIAAEVAGYDGTKANVFFVTCVSTSTPLYSTTVKTN